MSESLVVVDLASSGLVPTSSTSGASPDTPFLVHRLRRFIWFPELVFFSRVLGLWPCLAVPLCTRVSDSLLFHLPLGLCPELRVWAMTDQSDSPPSNASPPGGVTTLPGALPALAPATDTAPADLAAPAPLRASLPPRPALATQQSSSSLGLRARPLLTLLRVSLLSAIHTPLRVRSSAASFFLSDVTGWRQNDTCVP